MKRYLILSRMRFAGIFGIIACVLLAMSGLSSAQEVGLPNNPLTGRQIFMEKGCVKCHSIFGRGGRTGRDFGSSLAHLGPSGIFARMWNHSPEMSSLLKSNQKLPVFTEHEMADFIAFIYFLSYLDEEGDPARGQVVLKEKKCLACHQVGGQGTEVGPSLDKIRSYANPLSLAQRMWQYGLGMSALMTQMKVPRPEFKGTELIDLFAYLRQISNYRTDVFTYLTPGKPRVGEMLFEKKGCLECHRIGNKGKAVGPDITRVELHLGVTQIATLMWKHGPGMWGEMKQTGKELPVFEVNELADLVAYLYYLKFTRQEGDFIGGQRVFIEKRCVQCHAINGVGGNVATDLARSEKTLNYIRITTYMWNHNEQMRALMKKMDFPMPRFSESEMTDLFTYLLGSRKEDEK
ncbi:MAG: c-type cytochrome [Desulfobacterales bacterium]|nr:c-type cytochrome [Desulfobacterales bacterium]